MPRRYHNVVLELVKLISSPPNSRTASYRCFERGMGNGSCDRTTVYIRKCTIGRAWRHVRDKSPSSVPVVRADQKEGLKVQSVGGSCALWLRVLVCLLYQTSGCVDAILSLFTSALRVAVRGVDHSMQEERGMCQKEKYGCQKMPASRRSTRGVSEMILKIEKPFLAVMSDEKGHVMGLLAA